MAREENSFFLSLRDFLAFAPPAITEQWERLHGHLVLTGLCGGFWLGFVFSASGEAATDLRRLTAHWFHHQGRALRELSPQSPAALIGTLPLLFDDRSLVAGERSEPPALADLVAEARGGPPPGTAGKAEPPACVWLECLAVDPPGSGPQPWRSAWTEVLLRLNERREALRRRLRDTGLLLVMHPRCKPLCRDLASDLWSVRSIVLEPDARRPATGSVSAVPLEELSVYMTVPAGGVADSADFALDEARRRLARGPRDLRQAGVALVRAVGALLAEGRVEEARRTAQGAVELLKDAPAGGEGDRATALYWLARSEQAAGQLDQAAAHAEEALALRTEDKSTARLEWLDLAGTLALSRGDVQRALTWYTDAVDVAFALLEIQGRTPLSLFAAIASLSRRGDAFRKGGSLEEAEIQYRQAFAFAEELLSTYGETPQSLRAVAVGMYKLGHVARARGHLPEAIAAYQGAVARTRHLIERYGETKEALRELALALHHLGQAHRSEGLLTAADAAERESAALWQRLR